MRSQLAKSEIKKMKKNLQERSRKDMEGEGKKRKRRRIMKKDLQERSKKDMEGEGKET